MITSWGIGSLGHVDVSLERLRGATATRMPSGLGTGSRCHWMSLTCWYQYPSRPFQTLEAQSCSLAQGEDGLWLWALLNFNVLIIMTGMQTTHSLSILVNKTSFSHLFFFFFAFSQFRKWLINKHINKSNFKPALDSPRTTTPPSIYSFQTLCCSDNTWLVNIYVLKVLPEA